MYERVIALAVDVDSFCVLSFTAHVCSMHTAAYNAGFIVFLYFHTCRVI